MVEFGFYTSGDPTMIDTSNKEIQSHDDFIVVGAGAAGSVLAAELSASGAQVLVIESGGPDNAPTIADPSIWFYNVGGPLDYHLPVVPSPRLNNRKFNMALGHVLGGGGSINAMVWIRGTQADYDGWAENGAGRKRETTALGKLRVKSFGKARRSRRQCVTPFSPLVFLDSKFA
jgi:hypothetical protein